MALFLLKIMEHVGYVTYAWSCSRLKRFTCLLALRLRVIDSDRNGIGDLSTYAIIYWATFFHQFIVEIKPMIQTYSS